MKLNKRFIAIFVILLLGSAAVVYAAQTLSFDKAKIDPEKGRLKVDIGMTGFTPTLATDFTFSFAVMNNANGESSFVTGTFDEKGKLRDIDNCGTVCPPTHIVIDKAKLKMGKSTDDKGSIKVKVTLNGFTSTQPTDYTIAAALANSANYESGFVVGPVVTIEVPDQCFDGSPLPCVPL